MGLWRNGEEFCVKIPSQEEIKKAREDFQRHGTMPTAAIRPEILESWTRSRNAGVTVENADKTLISSLEIRQRIDARSQFFDTASSVLAGIYRFTIGSGYIATLFDEEGYVLSVTGDEEILKMAKANALTEGCNRKESNLGTNGIGTALVLGDAIQVFGEEHYFPLHYKWTCSGAPVFDSRGRIVGGVCIIGPLDKANFHTLGMVSAAAKSISQMLLMQDAYDKLNRAQQSVYTMLSAWPAGILLVDDQLRIIKGNPEAAKLLECQIDHMEGRALNEFISSEAINVQNIRERIAERSVSLEIDGKTVRASLSVENTDAGDHVLFLEKTETLHKRVNRIIGSEAHFTFDSIVGQSAEIKEAIGLAKLASQNDASIFLKGESGTGKEMFAQAIHNASGRRDGPFVAINCGAIPKSLIESELFGYEGGSFTGAKREGCPGKFELANGGTIFLDEIGDMPFDVQVSLLRVLQCREISRIGSSKTIRISVRVISATHQNIKEAVARNQFRNDLYYRLNVFDIQIPALRERKEDIPVLAEHFLAKYMGNGKKRVKAFSRQALQAMEQYDWPGNVRELENVVERAVYMAPDGLIQPENLSFWDQGKMASVTEPACPNNAPLPEDVSAHPPIRFENERTRIERALYTTGYNVKKTAETIGMSRRTLYRRMERYGLSKEKYRK
jgi:transcriptional regulator of acetoin/glycerol metabolism